MKDLIRILLQEGLSENTQQADKLYFNTGKLSPEVKQGILNITHGDPFTRLVADLVYHFSKHHKIDNYLYKMAKNFHEELISYDKNLFPIAYDPQMYGVENKPNEQYILTLVELLSARKETIYEFRKLPSIGSRNLKELSRTPFNDQYYFKDITKKLGELNGNIRNIPKNEKGEQIMFKIFNSKHDLDQMVEVAAHFAHSFTEGDNRDKQEILELIPTINAEIIQDSDKIMVIKVNDYESMQEIGCTSLWCFARPQVYHFWGDYAPWGFVYVIFDFTLDPEDAKFMMVMLPDNYEVYASTNVYLEELGIDNPYMYLVNIGVNMNKLTHKQKVAEELYERIKTKLVYLQK